MSKFEYVFVFELWVVVDFKLLYGLFIDGEFVDLVSGMLFKIISSVIEEVLVEIVEGDAVDVDCVVCVVCWVFECIWSCLFGVECGKYLFCIVWIL